MSGEVVDVLAQQQPTNAHAVLGCAARALGGTTVRSGAELIVLALHGTMLSHGFRLTGINDTAAAAAADAATENDAPAAPQLNTLPSEWNLTGDTFSFRYAHERSTLTFLVKAVKIAEKLLVHGMASEDGKLFTIELDIPAFISPSATFPTTPADEGALAELVARQPALDNLVHRFRTQIIDQVAPAIAKDGYEPTASESAGAGPGARSQQQQQQQQQPANEQGRGYPPHIDPLIDPRFRGGGPSARQPPFGMGGIYGGVVPGGLYGIGDVDLDPFAAAPGIIPPRGGFGGMHPGGGMVVGPDHPMFGGGSGGFGFYGDPGMPRGAVPPGARFDPIGPFGPRPSGGFGVGRGGPRRSMPGEPDNDELPPPGYNDMFM